MKITIVFLLCIVAFCFFPILRSSAQDKNLPPDRFRKPMLTPSLPGQPLSDRAVRYRIAGKRASQYTAEDWGKLIDSTWGPGQTATEQLQVFDTFYDLVDKQWGGFPNFPLNWDSVRSVYRPQIGTGLSRGRFYALMSRMWLALLEHHTYITDLKVDTIFNGESVLGNYRSGIPLICIGTAWWDWLGAPVTAMPDSTGLVYRAAPGNPLGLESGDIVLGYEGVPWKKLYWQLLNNGVPVSRNWSFGGSTPESRTHNILSAVGYNWGLFDTIDIVKYSTGDTLHLPTAPLAKLSQTVMASDQVPIAGVPMPQPDTAGIGGVESLSWGVVQGTNVGYIYVWNCGKEASGTSQLFYDAIYDLRYNRNVEGLVIDFRMNWGGDETFPNKGFSQLFNFDPTSNVSLALRDNPSNHMSFSFGVAGQVGFTPGIRLFDHPIAVLIGPSCFSAGDFNAFRLRFHPMVRFFGKATNGAFILYGNNYEGTISDAWKYLIPTGSWYSNVPGEGYLVHKGVQPDEEVWLTRDGVARGEDDVVKRALQWISTLTYAHDIALNGKYYAPGLDSICITVTLSNPLHHTATISAVVIDDVGVVRDSVLLFNDGLHGDGNAGDSIWGFRISLSSEGVFSISVRTDDITQGTFRRLPNITQFTTSGPLTLDSVAYTKTGNPLCRRVIPYIKNNGKTLTIHGASVNLICNDPWVTNISPYPYTLSLSDIPPGGIVPTNGSFLITYDTVSHPSYINEKFEMAINGYVYWTDSARYTVTGVEEEKMLPITYELRQNFPNPFNPSTTIEFQIPLSPFSKKGEQGGFVTLKVYDLLGREVAVLVNEKKSAGTYTVQFDGSKFTSGVYFYRLQAGNFVQTKKFVLLK